MGGSAGSFYRGTSKPDPDKVIDQIKSSVEKTKNKEFEIDVEKMFAELLAKINDRDYQDTHDKLGIIRVAIEDEIDGSVNLRFGGSVAKHTYVDGLSDIDALVYLNNSELSNKTPEEVKSYFFEKIKSRFQNENVSQGNLAVSVKFRNGTEIQLLPAVKFKTGYKIADSKHEWSSLIKPDRFAKLLRGANIKMKGKLLPVIKLAKSIVAKLPDRVRPSGYHMEAIAIEAFYNYDGERKIRPMLRHFFFSASKIVQKRIVDKTGQSVHVDGYLGNSNSLERKIVSNKMDQINRSMQNANLMNSIDYWNRILE